MGSYTTRIINDTEFSEIINAIRNGYEHNGVCRRPNNAVATALVLQANLGLRISDILHLTLSSIVKDGNHYRLDIVEQKTNKSRTHIVPTEIYDYISSYCQSEKIGAERRIFQFSEHNIQLHLKNVCEYLKIENVSTHSFRKYSGDKIYESTGHDIELVRSFYQHTSVATTQRYLKRGNAALEKAICGTVTFA